MYSSGYLKKCLLIVLCGAFYHAQASSQNINGEKIIVGRESITIINFPDKVVNINFSDEAAYDYYIPKRREDRSISIQFNKEKVSGPVTGLLVNEGGRSHMFRVLFDSTYDINDDSRPPLWYDHSSLKELKTFVKNQKDPAETTGGDELVKEKERQKKEAAARREEALAAQKKAEEPAVTKAPARAMEETAAERKQKEAALEFARKEAKEKEQQLQLAAEKEAAARKAADEQSRKEAAQLALQKEQDEKKQKELKEKQDAAALARAQKEAAEKEQRQQEQWAQKKKLEEEQRKKAADELARKEAARKEAQERLARLEAENKKKEAEKAYSEAGIWQRYGKKGIDLYNFPRNQVPTVNSDFYVVQDTLRNFRISDSLIHTDIPEKLSIAADKPINKGVMISLENIVFKDVHTYYKLKIENNTDEDFLMGRTYMYWYDGAEQAKMMVKGSYLTYIGFFPLVRPKTTQHVVFVTRSPNVVNNESLVLFVDERRKEKGTASIVIPGADYNRELEKVQVKVGIPASGKPAAPEMNSDSRARKRKK
ncbi:cell envelope integrity protein TolA [Niabella sp.]|uniref:cell envelope integrity protein TolA n=1 Tax=Niabella sp. TaxID=1962976 RepID=UPI00261797D2|nr:cell envelope integrity protein TolA [Niabella sp.]